MYHSSSSVFLAKNTLTIYCESTDSEPESHQTAKMSFFSPWMNPSLIFAQKYVSMQHFTLSSARPHHKELYTVNVPVQWLYIIRVCVFVAGWATTCRHHNRPDLHTKGEETTTHLFRHGSQYYTTVHYPKPWEVICDWRWGGFWGM